MPKPKQNPLPATSKGQSLVEVLGATMILVISVLVLVTANTRSVYNAALARDQAQATQYSQVAIEKIRAYRDINGWSNFADNCDSILDTETPPSVPFSWEINYCQVPDSEPVRSCSRTDDGCEVKVVVSWADSHGLHQSELTTRLTSWK